MPFVTWCDLPVSLGRRRKQVSLHILPSHPGGTGTEVSGPPCHHHLLRGKQFPKQSLIISPTTSPMARTMFLLLLSSPILAQGAPAPHPQSALPQKSCGCVSEEEKRTLSPTSSNLTMANCGKTCSPSPFFAFSAPAHTDLHRHLQSETDIRSSVGSCLCSTTKSSSPTPCSENKNVPVFCTVSLPGEHNQTGKHPHYYHYCHYHLNCRYHLNCHFHHCNKVVFNNQMKANVRTTP